jgi:hypothetical protein
VTRVPHCEPQGEAAKIFVELLSGSSVSGDEASCFAAVIAVLSIVIGAVTCCAIAGVSVNATFYMMLLM